MSRTANIFTRVEPDLKDQAEDILAQLGISMSAAVGMFLRQVVLHRGMPFDISLPTGRPLAAGALSREQFDAEISKACRSIEEGRTVSNEEIRKEMLAEFGA